MPRTVATQRQVPRNMGTSLLFNGSNTSVTRANTASIDMGLFLNKLTVAAWVKVTALTGSDQNIANKQNFDAGTNEWQLNMMADRTVRLLLWIGNSPFSASSTQKLVIGNWYHIVGRYDGVNIKVYINGVESATAAQTGNIDDDNAAFGVGKMGDNSGYFFSGNIDDVRLYKRALTATEITSLFNGIDPSSTDLQLWYKFDEGSGSSATDSSGNANTGTITNATYSSDVFMVVRTAAGQRQLVRDFGTCLNCRVLHDRVNRANTTSLDITTGGYAQSLTVSCWFNCGGIAFAEGASTSASYHPIVNKDNSVSATREWQLAMNADGQVRLIVFIGNAAKTAASIAGLAKVGVWNHIVGRYDGATIKVYLNGTEVASTNQTGDIDDDNAAFQVGDLDTFSARGKIDDVRVYNTVLSPTAITNLYYGIEPPTTNLKLQYKFDEGSGTTANDSSGNTNTGTITSATYSTDVFMKSRTIVS